MDGLLIMNYCKHQNRALIELCNNIGEQQQGVWGRAQLPEANEGLGKIFSFFLEDYVILDIFKSKFLLRNKSLIYCE